jgi:hypothetical protein
MVKFQVGTVRKRYLNNKRLYEYKRISLNIPRKFHTLVNPFLGKQLNMEVCAKENALTITLKMNKNVQSRPPQSP